MLEKLMGSLLGNQQQKQDYQGYVNRYEQGAPHEGYDDQEVMDRYQQVSRGLPQDVYEESAEEAFAKMSPQERQEFSRHLRQRAQQQNVDFVDRDGDGTDDRSQDPRELARMTGRMNQQQPGMLGQLLGGGGGGVGGGNMLDNPLAKAALAGVAAMAVKRAMGGR